LITALSEAFQVNLRPWRQSIVPLVNRDEKAAARVNSVSSPSTRNLSFLSELHTYSNGLSEVDRGGDTVSKRRSLLRLSALVVFLSVIVPKLAPSIQSLFEVYSQCLVTNPLITKVLTGGVLATLGDALAQAGDSNKPYDSARAASFAAFDSCYRVFQHMAFPFIIAKCQGHVLSSLVSALPGLTVGATPMLAVCERVIAYQMCVVPLLYYPVFFTFTGFMQGLDAKGTFQRAKGNFLPCWKRNLMFWVPIQAIMFGLVPQRFQVSFTCVMGILWSLILSVTAGAAKKK
jgi:hypothetical protein